MFPINIHNTLYQDFEDLKILFKDDWLVTRTTFDEVHCKLRDKHGCLGTICPYFSEEMTSNTTKDLNCNYPPHGFVVTLAQHEMENAHAITNLIEKLDEKIPEVINRWCDKNKCEYFQLARTLNNDLYVMWTYQERKKFSCEKNTYTVIENIGSPSPRLTKVLPIKNHISTISYILVIIFFALIAIVLSTL